MGKSRVPGSLVCLAAISGLITRVGVAEPAHGSGNKQLEPWEVTAFPSEQLVLRADAVGGAASAMDARASQGAARAAQVDRVCFKFDVSGARAAVRSASVRLYGSSAGSTQQTLGLYAVAQSSWTDAGVDASKVPSLGPQLTRVAVRAAGWYDWDISAHVAEAVASKRTTIALCLRDESNSAPLSAFAEASQRHHPELRYSACGVGTCPPILGVHVGNRPADVLAFETWLGRRVDGVLAFAGHQSWKDYDGSIPWAAELWQPLGRPVLWSVPLLPRGAKLEEAAKGAYNGHYLKAARSLAGFRPEDAVVYVRTAWEWNGDWYPWSVGRSQRRTFIAAWRQFVDTFRSVSPRFRFDWCTSMGRVPFAWQDAYPGDAYVDVIGIDIYDETRWSDVADPRARFDRLLTRSHGLNWIAQFAAARKKPISIAEWGVGGDGSGDNAVFVRRIHDWIARHPVVYHAYWDCNTAYPGQLSAGQYPAAGAAYRQLFGR